MHPSHPLDPSLPFMTKCKTSLTYMGKNQCSDISNILKFYPQFAVYYEELRACSHFAIFFLIATAICLCLYWTTWDFLMLSQ